MVDSELVDQQVDAVTALLMDVQFLLAVYLAVVHGLEVIVIHANKTK
jgi:hypothetical protein